MKTRSSVEPRAALRQPEYFSTRLLVFQLHKDRNETKRFIDDLIVRASRHGSPQASWTRVSRIERPRQRHDAAFRVLHLHRCQPQQIRRSGLTERNSGRDDDGFDRVRELLAEGSTARHIRHRPLRRRVWNEHPTPAPCDARLRDWVSRRELRISGLRLTHLWSSRRGPTERCQFA
jgi:hypothetical protein